MCGVLAGLEGLEANVGVWAQQPRQPEMVAAASDTLSDAVLPVPLLLLPMET